MKRTLPIIAFILSIASNLFAAPTLNSVVNCTNSGILTCSTAGYQAGDVFVALENTTGCSNPPATCAAGWTYVGNVLGLGSGCSTVTICQHTATTEASTIGPISAVGNGNTSWGGNMLIVRSSGSITLDQFVGTRGNGLASGSQQLNNATTTQPDELVIYNYSGNINNAAMSGSGLTSIISGGWMALDTFVQATPGLLPVATITGTSTGSNSEGEIFTFYATGATPTPSPTATASPTATPTPPPPTPTPTTTPTPQPTPAPCIPVTATSINNAPGTTLNLNNPPSTPGDLQVIYLLGSDINPIIPNQLDNVGPAVGSAVPWQHVYSLHLPSPIGNNVWTYKPTPNEPAFISVNSPTAEAEDFIASINLHPACRTFHDGEFGQSQGVYNVSTDLSSPRVVTWTDNETCIVFAADDFANNLITVVNPPTGFTQLLGTPNPVVIGYFEAGPAGPIPSFSIHNAGTSGTLNMQVICE